MCLIKTQGILLKIQNRPQEHGKLQQIWLADVISWMGVED